MRILEKYKKIPVPARASIWFLVCALLQKGISVVTTPIFTRLLNTAEYGEYSAFNSWLGIVTVLVTMHMYSGVFQQGLVKFEEDKKIFASSIQGLTFTMVLAWTGIYFAFSGFWNKVFDLTTIQVLAMLVMVWTSTVFNLWATTQRVEYNYRLLVLITAIVSLAKPLVGVLLVIHTEDKVTARILGLALVELIAYSWLFILQMRMGNRFFSKKYWMYALQFNIPLIPHYLSQIILNSTDRIMIKELVGSSEAGIYSVAYSISMIMTLLNNAVMQTLTPWIYKKIKSNKAEEISKIAYPALVVIAALDLFLLALAPEVIAIFAPTSYYDAIYVIPPVAMSVFFLFAYSLFSSFEFYFEKSKLVMVVSVIGAALNIVLNYIFIKLFGYYAAGYTTLLCYLVYTFGHYLIMSKICKEKLPGVKVYDGKTLLLMSGVFMIFGFALLFTYQFPVLRYSIICMMVVVIICMRNYITDKVMSFISLRKKK